MDKSRYPKNWPEISLRIRERAGNKCEQCSAPNGQIIMRSTENPGFYLVASPGDGQEWRLPDGEPAHETQLDDEFAESKLVKVVLTVHHIGVPYPNGEPGDPHDKMDCRDENLVALCQRCHLIADMPTHVANAKVTRLIKKRDKIAEQGQLELFH